MKHPPAIVDTGGLVVNIVSQQQARSLTGPYLEWTIVLRRLLGHRLLIRHSFLVLSNVMALFLLGWQCMGS